jgi:hypothetical protein
LSAFKLVRLKDVWAMLDRCMGKGKWTAVPGNKNEYWRVTVEGKPPYPRLQTGKHGSRENPQIECGQVKNMVRLFGIEECAGPEFGFKRKKKQEAPEEGQPAPSTPPIPPDSGREE